RVREGCLDGPSNGKVADGSQSPKQGFYKESFTTRKSPDHSVCASGPFRFFCLPSRDYPGSIKLRQGGQAGFYLLLGILVILKLAGQVRLVRAKVEVAVSAEAEHDRTSLSPLTGFERFFHGAPDGMTGFRRWKNALGSRKTDVGLKNFVLFRGTGVEQTLVMKCADLRAHAVITEPARVNGRGDEVVAQGIHFHQGRQACRVAKVVCVFAPREAWGGRRLNGQDPRLRSPLHHGAKEWEGEAGEIAAASRAAHHHVRPVGSDQLELLDHLLTDHRLV